LGNWYEIPNGIDPIISYGNGYNNSKIPSHLNPKMVKFTLWVELICATLSNSLEKAEYSEVPTFASESICYLIFW